MFRGRFRLVVAVVLVVLVAVNVLVIFYVGPALTADEPHDLRDRDWEYDPSNTEEPDVYEDVEDPNPPNDGK